MHKPATGARAVVTSRLTVVLGIALLALLNQGCGKDETSAAFGLELTKPAGWTYVSNGVSAAHGEEIDYDEATLGKAIASHTSAPLFAVLKRAPPNASLNPTFGINLERDPKTRGQTALAMLALRVAGASVNGAFKVVEPAVASKLAGLDAAQAELRSNAGSGEDQQPQIRVRLHLLVIDDVTVLMAATDAVSGDNDASSEFQQILDSLRLPGATPAH